MSRVKRIFSSCLRDDSGQDLVEYALVIVMLGLAGAAMLSSLSGSIASTLSGIGSRLTSSF